jgi:hypothetical protein
MLTLVEKFKKLAAPTVRSKPSTQTMVVSSGDWSVKIRASMPFTVRLAPENIGQLTVNLGSASASPHSRLGKTAAN